MKKLLPLVLALALCLALAACGGDESPSDAGGSDSTPPASASAPETTPDPAPETDPAPAETSGNTYENYSIFSDVAIYEAPTAEDLAGSAWEFSGGFMSGREMDEAAANDVLAMYGGKLQIEFVDTENANLVQGGGTMAGTYAILEDGVTANFSFELQGAVYDYVAVFTDVGEQTVMVLVSTADPESAFYMTPIL